MSTTNYLSASLLKHVLRSETYAKPAQVYVGLFTTSPTTGYPDQVNSQGTEVSGGGYSRQGIAANAWSDPATNNGGTPNGGSSNSTANQNDILFSTATTDQGTVGYFGIWDNSNQTSGLLYFAPLAASRQVLTGDIVKFPAGQLTVTCT